MSLTEIKIELLSIYDCKAKLSMEQKALNNLASQLRNVLEEKKKLFDIHVDVTRDGINKDFSFYPFDTTYEATHVWLCNAMNKKEGFQYLIDGKILKLSPHDVDDDVGYSYDAYYRYQNYLYQFLDARIQHTCLSKQLALMSNNAIFAMMREDINKQCKRAETDLAFKKEILEKVNIVADDNKRGILENKLIDEIKKLSEETKRSQETVIALKANVDLFYNEQYIHYITDLEVKYLMYKWYMFFGIPLTNKLSEGKISELVNNFISNFKVLMPSCNDGCMENLEYKSHKAEPDTILTLDILIQNCMSFEREDRCYCVRNFRCIYHNNDEKSYRKKLCCVCLNNICKFMIIQMVTDVCINVVGNDVLCIILEYADLEPLHDLQSVLHTDSESEDVD
jgi:hypothetical protein